MGLRHLISCFQFYTNWKFTKSICIFSSFPQGHVQCQKSELLVLTDSLILFNKSVQFSSVAQSLSDSLRPHKLQHARPPCPSPTPGVHPNSCPSGQWCHPAISSSVVPFSSCPQSLPASESFLMRQLFVWGGQSIGVSASALVFQWTPRTDLL